MSSPSTQEPGPAGAPGPTPFRLEIEQALVRANRQTVLLVAALYMLFQFVGAVTLLLLFFSLVFLLAAMLNPVIAWLQRHRVPRPLGAAMLGLLVLGGTAAVLVFAIPPLLDQGEELVRQWPQFWDGIRARLEQFLAGHPAIGREIPTSSELLHRAGPYVARVAGQLGRYTLSFLGAAVALLLLVILVVYSLASPQPLVAGLLGAVPERHRPKAERILMLVLARLKSYALGSLLLGVIVGTMTGIGLYFLKVPFPLLFAVIAGFGELLPNLGPLLSAIPPVLAALAIDPMLALWTAVLFVVVQQLENNLIVPIVMARTLDLHPLSVVFMMLVMGALFGLLGAVLAVPVTVVVKTLYQELYLSRQVLDPEALEAQSERIISDEETLEAEAQTEEAPASSALGTEGAGSPTE